MKSSALSVAEKRWQAVQDRAVPAEGQFFYAVLSTGIYCRPGCPSRLPRQENVRFYDLAEEAERAGFRPCLRCRPADRSVEERNATLVAAACRQIRESEEGLRLEELAAQAGMSRFHFHRIFRAVTGLTPRAFASGNRAEQVKRALQARATVTEAIHEAGFGSSSRFYSGSQERLGMKPAVYQQGGKGEQIQFSIGDSPLGPVLVAATGKGICAIFLDDDRQALVAELQRRFPLAELIPGDNSFQQMVEKVIAQVDEPAAAWELPLDTRGTVFQEKVWQALRRIPHGTTRTYREIAEELGMPAAVRAVAGACGANFISIVIPCHRVVRSDGSISGYRWGVERKRFLLRREGCGEFRLLAEPPKRTE